ncbi:hypothetical protein GCM10029992_59710 [Glycomyces albus]
MNRTLKRVLGLTGSVVVGLAGAVTFASAAQAHHANVTGTAPCLEADGTWEVTWSVNDWDWKGWDPQLGAGWITGVTSTSDSEIVGDFSLDTTSDDDVFLPYPGETPLSATQVVTDVDAESVTLKVAGEWSNGQTDMGDGHKATVLKPTQECEQPEEPSAETSASAVSDCFAITITASNSNPEALAEFTHPERGRAGDRYPRGRGAARALVPRRRPGFGVLGRGDRRRGRAGRLRMGRPCRLPRVRCDRIL